MRSAFRIAGPPVLAVIGCLPVALARSALENDGDPFGAATTGAIIALIFTALAAGWIHQREQIKAWFRDLQESAGTAPGASSRPTPATAGGGADPEPGQARPQARPHQGHHQPPEETMSEER